MEGLNPVAGEWASVFAVARKSVQTRGWWQAQLGVARAYGSRASLRDSREEGPCRGFPPRDPKFQHPHPQRRLSRGQPCGGGILVQWQQWPCSQPPPLPSGPTCVQPPPSQPPALEAQPMPPPDNAARRALRVARTAQHGRSSPPHHPACRYWVCLRPSVLAPWDTHGSCPRPKDGRAGVSPRVRSAQVGPVGPGYDSEPWVSVSCSAQGQFIRPTLGGDLEGEVITRTK